MDQLYRQIDRVAARFRRRKVWSLATLLAVTCCLVGFGQLWWSWRNETSWPGAWTWPLTGFGLGCFVLAVASMAMHRNRRWTARRIEERFPDLQQRLLTAMDRDERQDAAPLGYLDQVVIDEATEHAQQHDWRDVVPRDSMLSAQLGGVFAWLALLTVGGMLSLQSSTKPSLADIRDVAPLVDPSIDVLVEPGNVELERGRTLIVVAKFGQYVPNEAALVVRSAGTSETATDANARRIPMIRSLDDPLYGAHVPEVVEDLTYSVDFGGRQSEIYRVTVFEYPTVVSSDASLRHPEYTALPEKVIEETTRVTAVEGTQLTWLLHVNKLGIQGTLTDSQGAVIALQADANNDQLLRATIDLARSDKWQVDLTDEQHRANQIPLELTVKVLPNSPPTLKLELARDARVSPLEEMLVKAKASDDFGLRRYGLAYSIAGKAPQDVVLGQDAPRLEQRDAQHLLDFEALQAQPDELLSYHFWAEDLDPHGQPRRTLGDMFFAEVRHFEEIFREGEQPPGGQSQQQQQQGESPNEQQAEELAELQKQIISASWRVIRRELDAVPTPEFGADVDLLIESQQTAMEQARAMEEQLSDATSQQHLQVVLDAMQQAVTQLTLARQPDIGALQPALVAEQAAYQALLRLRAREFSVTQSQQQNSSPSSSSRSQSNQRFQQQLQQLQLQNDQNRYETQQSAESQEDQQQRESRQVLNRLRELARRQEDINNRLQELQTQLQLAQTEQERQELERQLKRLRDEQQQLLRDTDEAAQRMDESQNQQQQMQQAQQQLQQARENVQNSSDALQQNDLSQALSAGTRAERQFEEVRDEMRRQTANQFSEAMREMRTQARELDDTQQQLSQQMQNAAAEAAASEGPGLREENASTESQTPEQLAEQRKKLDQLLDRMKDTIKEAEEAEPLLAQKLYDSFRETSQRQVSERLDVSQQLWERGLTDQAREMESEARDGITKLREDVESAANNVLGDEAESLRRALRELEQLSDQLDEEMRRANPDAATDSNATPQDGSEGDERNEGSTNPSAEESGERRLGDESPLGGSAQESGIRQRDSADPSETGSRTGEESSSGRDAGEPASGQNTEPNNSEQPPTGAGTPGEGAGQPPGEQSPQNPPDTADARPTNQESGQQQQQQQQQGQQQGQPGQQQGQQGSGGQQAAGGGAGDREEGGRERTGNEANRSPRTAGGQAGRGAPNAGDVFEAGGGFLDQLADDTTAAAPLTGDDFREWSDRMRDVEEMIEDPELRNEAAQIRDRARGFREDFKRHSKEPQWNLVRDMVSAPLRELTQKVSEELLRRSAERNALVPIDRDPVPDQFTEQVRKYYERLGVGE